MEEHWILPLSAVARSKFIRLNAIRNVGSAIRVCARDDRDILPRSIILHVHPQELNVITERYNPIHMHIRVNAGLKTLCCDTLISPIISGYIQWREPREYRASRDYKLKWILFQRRVYNVIERMITADGSKLSINGTERFFLLFFFSLLHCSNVAILQIAGTLQNHANEKFRRGYGNIGKLAGY